MNNKKFICSGEQNVEIAELWDHWYFTSIYLFFNDDVNILDSAVLEQ